ncbi:MAG: prepilin-type N-terminal cleavage/methylation domain-containing protein [Deltaproteobacteria bacterium]|nr:prepilin-type N-terminal cleavage/methylation domain-containing protein [Deltaproteobacteria bacterium]
MNNLRHNQVGFTLIELLVVVAIIAMLAAIAMPNFWAYRARGYEAQVNTDLRNAATANEAYFASTTPSVYMPAGVFVTGTPPGFTATPNVTLPRLHRWRRASC